jgi:serine/threonine protein kinase
MFFLIAEKSCLSIYIGNYFFPYNKLTISPNLQNKSAPMNRLRLETEFIESGNQIKHDLKSYTIEQCIGKGRWGQVYDVKYTDTVGRIITQVMKVIALDTYLLDDESCEEEYNDPIEFDVKRVTEEMFMKEAKVSLTMGDLGVAPRCFGYTITQLQFNKKINCRCGCIFMEKYQYNLVSYSKMIKTNNQKQDYWDSIEEMMRKQALEALEQGIIHPDLHSGENIVVNIDTAGRPIDLRFIDWGFVTTINEYMSRQTSLIGFLLGKKLLYDCNIDDQIIL